MPIFQGKIYIYNIYLFIIYVCVFVCAAREDRLFNHESSPCSVSSLGLVVFW